MFEYNKLILEKVSFDSRIFRKELKKAFKNSTKEEIQRLKTWWRNNAVKIKAEEVCFR